MDKEEMKEARRALQALADFVLSHVDDPQSWEVQKRLNEIDGLYWECFDKYEI